jgi:PAS domain S-box-containing protein
MQKEPEIVKILREEERLRNTSMKSSNSSITARKSEDTSIDASHDTVMMFKPDEKQLSRLDPNFLEILCKAVFETSLVVILVLDAKGRIISWNNHTKTLFGKSNDELFQKSITSLYSPEEWLKIESCLNSQDGFEQQIETKVITKQNELLDVIISQSILKNEEGKNLGSLHIIKDISEQIQAENRLNNIIEHTDDSIYLLDTQNRYLMVNNELLSRLGCTREKVLGKTFNNFHSTEESKEFTQKIKWVFENRKPLKYVHCRGGKWFLRTLNPVTDTSVSRPLTVLVVSKDITDTKKAEELLIKKGEKYQTRLESYNQAIFLIDKKGKIINANDQIKEWLGYEPNEIFETDLFSLPFFTEESKNLMKINFSKKKLNETIYPYKIELLTKYNEKRIGLVYTAPLKNEQGKITTDFVVISDVTEQKNIEDEQQIKHNTITSSVNAIILTDLEGNLTYVNEYFLRMWGFSNDKDVIGKPIAHFWKMKTKYVEMMDSLVDSGAWIGELTGIRKDHSTFPVQLSANIINDKSHNHICIIWSFEDITKCTTTVETLNDSQKRFRVVLENSLDMIYQLNIKKGTCEYISPSSIKIIGYTAEELTSFTQKQIKELIHPEDSNRRTQHLKMITQYEKRKNPIQPIEYRINHKTLGYRWISDTCSAIFDEKNEPISIVGTIEDITERKKVWDQLVKSEEKYRILAETSADGVFTTDALGRLTYVNPSFEKLCGRRKSQILATPFRKYLLEDSIYFFQQIFIDARKKDEKIENVELELVASDGDITPIEANIAPLKKDDEFSGVMCTVRDITQRREIEDELKKNERLKTEFMNIAAHELRSPVTPIKGYLDLIIHDNESDEKIKNWAKISLRNAERLLKLVNDILDVARLDSDTMRFDMEKIDVVELLNEIVEDMRPAITNKKLEFRVNIPTPLPHIIGDKNRLSQVLKNLIGNSLKFTDCGYIALEVEKKNNHILIAVGDTGIGISKDELKKIFTKFYQAYTGEDRNNEGTGLGLFISKEIVKKHKGIIWAESEVGKGSRFVVQLPYIYKMIVDFKT